MRVPGIRFECLGVYKNMEMLSFKSIASQLIFIRGTEVEFGRLKAI